MESITETLPRLLTVEEVARIFRLTPAAIRRMIRAKEFPAIRIGREYRVPQRVVENMLGSLNEKNLKDAAFGLWRNNRFVRGEAWIRKHRDHDQRSLEEILKDMETP